jgi:hypothetical protein
MPVPGMRRSACASADDCGKVSLVARATASRSEDDATTTGMMRAVAPDSLAGQSPQHFTLS